ncbi:L-lactate dehydrogenase complex protein LldG [Chitinophaga terrae (ex Kim and Jung 2007)]|uniref:L-lactate dehydrogenase complex protein LldG n=1 Tax=Chitinophaga terrae (ex Kim and Jung 2007) TaxID=408074 RepID=A0A1H4FIP7_9BACT|nr:LUD domain-containing protein [Chitinophaga terrae (ex Kim and Jung 2007)]MDQ0105830.1 L-lactate dehydrogenase complex protein LldG [Chitinophaga terrae (ex Kim and Jung 2007)]SEA96927.1 L-lactate dehydrogenase complex protein LldG [Chitinophaga terrae (ex Kim and Jung 2007)]
MDSNTRNQVLSAVRSQLPHSQVACPATPEFPKKITALLPEFEERIKDAGGSIYRPSDLSAAQKLLSQQFPDARVICSATPDIQGNRDIHAVKNPHELADVDVGVIRARFGVAENGMVWLAQEDLVVNALGFLSQHLVVLLNPSELVADMYDAYLKVCLEDSAYGCFMMGPSATADIGAVLVHGAQGARSLSVYLI